MDARSQQMLSAPPIPLLAKMSAPNSIAFFIQALVSLAEVWFIGRLGSLSLAAIALVFPLLMLTQMLSGGAMGGAVAAAIARALGAADPARAERLIWHALALAVAGALTLLILFVFFGAPFLRFMGGAGDILSAAMSYSFVLFIGGIFLWFVGIVSAVFRGMGDMRFPALMMTLSALIQVPLSGVLILGVWGFPQLGITGAAVSAVLTNAVLCAVMMYRLSQSSAPIRLHTRAVDLRKDHFRDILGVALPASIAPFLTVLTAVLLTAVISRFGEQALAGYGIGARLEFLLVPLVFGIGASMTSLVGIGIGAGDIKRAETVGWVGALGAGLLAGSIGLLLAALSWAWMPIFTNDPAVSAVASRYIHIVGPWYAFHGLGLVLYFGSQGAGAMRWPVIALSLRALIAIGGALLLTNSLVASVDGVFYAAALSMVAYGTIMLSALKLGAWRRLGIANGS
ncbi:MAG: MATE family efflux transporter [Proteobacteria bacterium]|nr:MATE family efflux transporter [Pseudomonadota bacterium]